MSLPSPFLHRLALATLGLLLAGGALGADNPPRLPPGVSAVRSLEGIDEFRLANGLQVLLFPDASKPTTTVNVTYKVGSRMESYGETGMAHLLEHLMFKGSAHFPDPDKEFAARGFRNNGTTYFDRTNYFSTFAASDDNLKWALAREADAMTESFIARKDLDSEMTVVRNEYEMGETSPVRVLTKRLYSAMYDWHNYGKEAIGNRSDIENVAIDNLQAFYHRYYQPDNAVLIVAGSFDEEKALGWIADTFGRIARPQRVLPPLWTVEPVQDGERAVTVRRKGDVQLVMVGYHVPAARSADSAALDLAVEVLADTPTGRLHHALVETGIASEVFGEHNALYDPGSVVFGARVKPGDSIEKARDRLIEVVETAFAKAPPSAEEVDRVHRDADTGAERVLDDPQEFGVAISESIAQGDWRLFFVDRDAMAKAGAEQAAAAAARYFRRDNRTVGLFIPEEHPQRADIPVALDVDTLLKDYVPRVAAAAGEAFDPSPQNIDARTQRLNVGDLRLALLPKRNKGKTVDVAMAFNFGDEKSLAGLAIVRELTGAMLARGTPSLSRQQIADAMTRLKMTGSLLDFQTDHGNLAEAIALSARVLREASFPAGEFDLLKRDLVTNLKAKLDEPMERARDAQQAHFDHYPPGDPRHYLTLKERLEGIEATRLEQIKDFYTRFWGTDRGEIAVVGDFDPEPVAAELRERFGKWHSAAPFAHILRDNAAIEPVRIFIDTPDKENAVYRARLTLDLRDDDPDAAALILANEIIGGGNALHSRLVDRVRQKDGLSYSVGSGYLLSSRDRASAWGIAAIAAPQNIAHVESDIREEIERVRRDGFTAEEVEEARQGLLQSRRVARSEDSNLASSWVSLLDLDRSFEFGRQLDDKIRALRVEDLNDVVRRLLDPARLTVVIAGDAKKGAR